MKKYKNKNFTAEALKKFYSFKNKNNSFDILLKSIFITVQNLQKSSKYNKYIKKRFRSSIFLLLHSYRESALLRFEKNEHFLVRLLKMMRNVEKSIEKMNRL